MALIIYSCCLFNNLWHRISILDLSADTFIYYIDNGMKVKKDSGCSLIEYDIYFKESKS